MKLTIALLIIAGIAISPIMKADALIDSNALYGASIYDFRKYFFGTNIIDKLIDSEQVAINTEGLLQGHKETIFRSSQSVEDVLIDVYGEAGARLQNRHVLVIVKKDSILKFEYVNPKSLINLPKLDPGDVLLFSDYS